MIVQALYNRTMFRRLIALFVCFVVLWSVLSTIEAPRTLASTSPEQQHAVGHAGGQAAEHEGSVEHHHLDDLPSQAHNDPPTETLGLLLATPGLIARSLVMAQPRAVASAEAGSPFLAGPLRPPCRAAVAG